MKEKERRAKKNLFTVCGRVKLERAEALPRAYSLLKSIEKYCLLIYYKKILLTSTKNTVDRTSE